MIGVNGAAGRIGKLVLYELLHEGTTVAAINDLATIDTIVEVLSQSDSAHGKLGWDVGKLDDGTIIINDQRIKVNQQRDPTQIDWAGAKYIVECTGRFTKEEDAEKHLGHGVEYVLISAPGKGAGIQTLVCGVNHQTFDPEKHILSNASCTTKALATPLRVLLDDGYVLQALLMDTTHACTNTDEILDVLDSAQALNNIRYGKTGAAVATALIIPELGGKMDGYAMRVPVDDGSFVNLFFVAYRQVGNVSSESVNKSLKNAESPKYMGRLAVLPNIQNINSLQHVKGRTESSLIVPMATRVINAGYTVTQMDPMEWKPQHLIGICSGYDNERGPAKDLALLTKYVMERTR